MSLPEPPPAGAPQQVELGGILDGRVDDVAALRAAVGHLGRAGLGPFELECSGARFSLLPKSVRVSGKGFDESAQHRFLEALSAVVACAREGTVESTLHARLQYPDQMVETLFLCKEGKVQPLSRVRVAEVASSSAETPPKRFALGRREMLLVAAGLLFAGVMWLWRSGLGEQALEARKEPLVASTGPFGELLTVKAERSMGAYRVEVRRGPSYPNSPADLAKLVGEAGTLLERAAREAVGSGSRAQVELVDEQGVVLDATTVALSSLLEKPEASVAVLLPARLKAVQLRLALPSSPGAGR